MTRSEWKAIQREIKRSVKEQERANVRALKDAARIACASKRPAVKAARANCKKYKADARNRAPAIRAAHKEALRRDLADNRAGAQLACVVGVQHARATADEACALARAGHLDAAKLARDLRRIDAANRSRMADERRALHRARGERQSESDDEVRGNIAPELVPLFERVKRKIKASDRMSRTEAFLHYVEAHPGEQFAALEDVAEARLLADLAKRDRRGR